MRFLVKISDCLSVPILEVRLMQTGSFWHFWENIFTKSKNQKVQILELKKSNSQKCFDFFKGCRQVMPSLQCKVWELSLRSAMRKSKFVKCAKTSQVHLRCSTEILSIILNEHRCTYLPSCTPASPSFLSNW